MPDIPDHPLDGRHATPAARQDLAGKLRGHAAAIRAGAVTPSDYDWFAASLERLAVTAETALKALELVEEFDAARLREAGLTTDEIAEHAIVKPLRAAIAGVKGR